MSAPNIVVAILAARSRPYPGLVRTIRRTWASQPVDGVRTIFYYGGPDFEVRGSDVFLPVVDDLWHTGEKTIAFFRWLLEDVDFDLLYRTNCSSYVDLENLREYARKHATPSGFYAGVIGTHAGATFASGSGYFLSRDLVELAAAKPDEWNHRYVDDWALGNLLNAYGYSPHPVPRRNYGSPREVVDVDTSLFHFRCRTPTTLRQGDVQIMLKIHAAFCRARGASVPPTLPVRLIGSRVLEQIAPVILATRARLRALTRQLRALTGH